MVRVFKAKWNKLLLEVAGVIIAGVALVAWKGVASPWFLVIFLVGYLAYRHFLAGAAIKTVMLQEDGVDIVPLFPWFKRRRWPSDGLATYKSVALRGQPFMGIVTPKEGKHEVVWALGTDQFMDLDRLLSRLLPPPQEQEDVAHEHKSAS